MQLIDRIKTLFTPTESGDVVTATGNRGQTSLFPNNSENTLATTTTIRMRGRSRSSTKGKTYVNKNLLEYHLHNAVKRAKGSRCCRCRSHCCCCLSGTQTQTQSWAESRPCPGEDPGRHKKATKQHQKDDNCNNYARMFVSFEKTLEGVARGGGWGHTLTHTQQGCISLAHKKLAHIFRVTLFLYGLPACLSACLPAAHQRPINSLE